MNYLYNIIINWPKIHNYIRFTLFTLCGGINPCASLKYLEYGTYKTMTIYTDSVVPNKHLVIS